MRAQLAVCLLFSVLISGACGGRLVHSGDDDGSTGGSFSAAATSSTGATSSVGGRSGGGSVSIGGGFSTAGTPFGGFPGAGAPSAGGGCACPPLACPPGYASLPNPDGCCFHCELACGNALCPAVACASGSHLEVLAGQCCPTCVRDSCAEQQESYQLFRQELLDKYSAFGCMTNSDCEVYYDENTCGAGCGIPVPIAAINNLDNNLQRYAQSSCSPNCMYPVPPCPAPATPFCYRGMCQ